MEDTTETHYDLHKILGNLRHNLQCNEDAEFRNYLLKGMLMLLLFRYLIACNAVSKEEENLRMIYILFTVLLANTLFYIEQADC
jgi:hypothetical protein